MDFVMNIVSKFFSACGFLISFSVYSSGVLSPMTILTVPRKRMYRVSIMAPSSPSRSYYELRVFSVKPKKVIRASFLHSQFVSTDKKRSMFGSEINLSSSRSIISSDTIRFIVPASSKVSTYLKFSKTPPRNREFYYYFKSVASPSALKQKKGKISARVIVDSIMIGRLIPAKPKPLPRFKVSSFSNGVIRFSNRSKYFTKAYIRCMNYVDGNKKGYKFDTSVIVPSSRQAVKGGMTWGFKQFLLDKQNSCAKKNCRVVCSGVYYKKYSNSNRLKLVYKFGQKGRVS